MVALLLAITSTRSKKAAMKSREKEAVRGRFIHVRVRVVVIMCPSVLNVCENECLYSYG